MDELALKRELAKLVRIYRAEFDITQEEMAKRCGISRRALQKVEALQDVSPKTQLAIGAVVDTWQTLCQP